LFAEKLQEQILQPVPHRHFALSIPKVLRGVIERERSLLSLLSQSSYQSILKSFQKLFDRKDVRPGVVNSIQTFGSFANFQPHCHCLVTEGVFTPLGEFFPLPVPATYIIKDIEENFRKILLERLHRAERLSEDFMNKLLQWNPSGFSAYAGQLVFDDEQKKLEQLARYLTRAPIRLGAISQANDGRVSIATPPHPLTGSTVINLDVLDWIHAICQQIPDHRQHLTRFYGAYANRTRQTLFQKDLSQTPDSGPEHDTDGPSTTSSHSRASWARLIRKVFETDPLLCPKCGAKMKIISVITEPAVVDKIIRHLQKKASEDKTATRAPPPTSNLLN
jgi:hypothetical protein